MKRLTASTSSYVALLLVVAASLASTVLFFAQPAINLFSSTAISLQSVVFGNEVAVGGSCPATSSQEEEIFFLSCGGIY